MRFRNLTRSVEITEMLLKLSQRTYKIMSEPYNNNFMDTDDDISE